jgi:hypothetical protein
VQLEAVRVLSVSTAARTLLTWVLANDTDARA